MKKCKTCAWFKTDSHIREPICEKLSPWFAGEENEFARAISFEGSKYGELVVAEDFGCILHEPKD